MICSSSATGSEPRSLQAQAKFLLCWDGSEQLPAVQTPRLGWLWQHREHSTDLFRGALSVPGTCPGLGWFSQQGWRLELSPAGAGVCNMDHGKQGMWPQAGNTVPFVSTLGEAALRIGWSFILTYFKTTRAAPYFLC